MTEVAVPPRTARQQTLEVEAIRVKLEHDFGAALPVPLIDLVWQEEQDRLADVAVTRFVPLMAERAARDRLRGLSGAPRR